MPARIKPIKTVTTLEGFLTDTGVNERAENEWRSENDNKMRTVSYRSSCQRRQGLVQVD